MLTFLAINGSFGPMTSKENLGHTLGKGTAKYSIYGNGQSNPIQIVLNSKHLAALQDRKMQEDSTRKCEVTYRAWKSCQFHVFRGSFSK